MLDEEDGFSDKQVSLLLAHTLCESPQQWCGSLPPSSMHSLENFYDLIESTFHHFDPEPLDKKMLKQWKTLQESHMDFWDRFCVL